MLILALGFTFLTVGTCAAYKALSAVRRERMEAWGGGLLVVGLLLLGAGLHALQTYPPG